MSRDASATTDLTQLVVGSGSANRVYPSDDAILDVLQARFRGELCWTWIRDSTLVSINPFRPLENVNDASKRAYELAYRDAAQEEAAPALQPHVYELAARVYLMMRRRKQSQSIVFRGLTGSGKSHNARLLSAQLLRLSAHSKKEARLAEQIRAFETVLEAFGHAKTVRNPSASRFSRYTELHYNDKGRIVAAQVLTSALDKSRLQRLSHDERSFHVFYQLLAGATQEERDAWSLEDPSDYALLASSGTYRLPSGPFSDDAINMEDLRTSMKILGFKPKHMQSIFSLLVAILLLTNIQFADYGTKEIKYESAHLLNPHILERVSHLLGVSSEALEQALTNKTTYARREVLSAVLPGPGAALQRDHLVQDLYSILFAFVVETANHRVAPPVSNSEPPYTQIILYDQPGFQSRSTTGSIGSGLGGVSPLVTALGHNHLEDFTMNYQNEVLHSFITRLNFDDSYSHNARALADGLVRPAINTMDNTACVELLRGGVFGHEEVPGGMLGVMTRAAIAYRQKQGDESKDDDLLKEFNAKFAVHTSYTRPNSGGAGMLALGPAGGSLFGINHYAGSCTYDVHGFVERDADLLDAAFVSLLRASSDGFIAKLVSGPSLSAETHYIDPNMVVQAQVSSRPLRQPTTIFTPNGDKPADGETDPFLDAQKIYPLSSQVNATLAEVMRSLAQTHIWDVACVRPNDSGSHNSFDKRRVKSQLRALLVPDLVARNTSQYSVEYEFESFCERYAYADTVGQPPLERIEAVLGDYGLEDGIDYVLGHTSVWLSFVAFKSIEDPLRAAEKERRKIARGLGANNRDETDSVLDGDDISVVNADWRSTQFGELSGAVGGEDLALRRTMTGQSGPFGDSNAISNYGNGGLPTPTFNSRGGPGGGPGGPQGPFADPEPSLGWGSEWEKSGMGTPRSETGEQAGLNPDKKKEAEGGVQEIETIPTSSSRRWWLRLVWLCTWYIPDFCLSRVGKLKRPDIRLAWREKVTIVWIIFFLCGLVLFWIIAFGALLCPGQDTVWNTGQLGGHNTLDNFWVAVAGEVYDITDFVQGDHSTVNVAPVTSTSLLEMAGYELTHYFPVPLSTGCPQFVTDASLSLTPANFTSDIPNAVHYSGYQTTLTGALTSETWYPNTFLPAMKQYRKGAFVWSWSDIKKQATDAGRIWSVIDNRVYDLSDYFNQLSLSNNADNYNFLPSSIANIFKTRPGQDITKDFNTAYAALSADNQGGVSQCLNNNFYYGKTDFRDAARCHVQNYILLAFTGLLASTIVAKFLAALQLTPKRNPEMLDKFVICQVPCYTEGEESLRRTVDSLAALRYDDKRKLMFLICDGNIIGSGNDRTTPRIVLDILGVDPSLDPEPLLFKSVGEGSKQLNYGKVYSGLYEFEGHVVPYIVVVKVGKPSERSKPGNRGKRDSQILLMNYLNRVHFDSPMTPLELEIYHQMRNVIGIDPAFYEYILMVDADTSVEPDSLNRLVACTADDSNIIAICGETKLDNEEGSWWTMIQVYEYYISHHLSKSFESLFGSVTCLPGCFSLYRIRTSDKGRPLIISNRVIDDYSENIVDTLHKKNLLSLGEDRYLTTIMMSHFPTFKMKFTPDAIAHTIAPDRFGVLLSQRRRWINSTIHNLVELAFLPELCGFCIFSMRFFVFLDLIGTIILPATCVYLVYMIVEVATKQAPVPIISLALLAGAYGLQAIIFILKREFMLIGWLVLYLLAYPIYSFFLPLYSFWCMDDFSWGNTRVVVGEGSNKKVIIDDEEKYDDSMIPLKRFSEYEAEAWEHGTILEDDRQSRYSGNPKSRLGAGSARRSPSPLSQQGDYYQNANPLHSSPLNPNGPRSASGKPMSQFGTPQLPMPQFGGSQAGSDHGGMNPYTASLHGPAMSMNLSVPGYAGSMYGMPQMMPRQSVMTNLNMFGGGGGDNGMGTGPGGFRPMTAFSMSPTANPFPTGPSQNANPTDDELLAVLRTYLGTQDLMTVTKKTAREAVATQFPNADLSTKKDFLNSSIDSILSSP
ncbi:chitin synthase [Clavulina sp. PMI_390]|nr:chitin synthase [Clavulina sp. PMI_390]